MHLLRHSLYSWSLQEQKNRGYCAGSQMDGKLRGKRDCIGGAGYDAVWIGSVRGTLFDVAVEGLCKIDGVKWYRILYAYPECITDELLEVIASEPKIAKYLDLPLQHVNGQVLKRMNRHGDASSITQLIRHIRKMVPGITLRTTLIAGFPGETKQQFGELCEWVKEMKIERLGCFAYSQEENTPAALLDGQLEEEIKQHRAELIMETQMNIHERYNQKQVGKTVLLLVEGFDKYAECYFGRGEADAPDIDGKIFFSAEEPLEFGDEVLVKIEEAMDYDLIGTMIDKVQVAEE